MMVTHSSLLLELTAVLTITCTAFKEGAHQGYEESSLASNNSGATTFDASHPRDGGSRSDQRDVPEHDMVQPEAAPCLQINPGSPGAHEARERRVCRGVGGVKHDFHGSSRTNVHDTCMY